MRKAIASSIALVGLLAFTACSEGAAFPTHVVGRWCHDGKVEIVLREGGELSFDEFPAVYLDSTPKSAGTTMPATLTLSGEGEWFVQESQDTKTLLMTYIQPDGSRFGGGWTGVQFETRNGDTAMAFYDDDPDTSRAYELTRCGT
jgi:hypothetical protein